MSKHLSQKLSRLLRQEFPAHKPGYVSRSALSKGFKESLDAPLELFLHWWLHVSFAMHYILMFIVDFFLNPAYRLLNGINSIFVSYPKAAKYRQQALWTFLSYLAGAAIGCYVVTQTTVAVVLIEAISYFLKINISLIYASIFAGGLLGHNVAKLFGASPSLRALCRIAGAILLTAFAISMAPGAIFTVPYILSDIILTYSLVAGFFGSLISKKLIAHSYKTKYGQSNADRFGFAIQDKAIEKDIKIAKLAGVNATVVTKFRVQLFNLRAQLQTETSATKTTEALSKDDCWNIMYAASSLKCAKVAYEKYNEPANSANTKARQKYKAAMRSNISQFNRHIKKVSNLGTKRQWCVELHAAMKAAPAGYNNPAEILEKLELITHLIPESGNFIDLTAENLTTYKKPPYLGYFYHENFIKAYKNNMLPAAKMAQSIKTILLRLLAIETKSDADNFKKSITATIPTATKDEAKITVDSNHVLLSKQVVDEASYYNAARPFAI